MHQDLLIEVAAKIAQVDFVERYYTEEKWRRLVHHGSPEPGLKPKDYSPFHTTMSEGPRIKDEQTAPSSAAEDFLY